MKFLGYKYYYEVTFSNNIVGYSFDSGGYSGAAAKVAYNSASKNVLIAYGAYDNGNKIIRW